MADERRFRIPGPESRPGRLDQPARRPRPSGWRLLLLALALVLCSLGMVGGAALLGVYHGAQDRLVLNQEEALAHYERGLSHRQAGEIELAVAEFEEALRLQPGMEQARAQLRELGPLAAVQPTLTSETRTRAVETLLAEAHDLYESGQWEEAARRLETVRSLDPAFEPELLDELLYATYFSAAQDYEAAKRDAEALAFYAQVLALRPNEPAALAAHERLQLYGAALLTWGQDWEQTVATLEKLHSVAPQFRDVAARLAQALTETGDRYGQNGAWCLAYERYNRALGILPSSDLRGKALGAQGHCMSPTATSRPGGSGAAGTPRPGATVQAPTGGGAALRGDVLYTQYDSAQNRYRIFRVPASGGEPVLVLEDASQPSVSPDGQWVAFHSWERDRLGILVAPLGGGQRNKPMVVTYLEDIQPSWSADSERLTFSSNRHGDRKWRVYLTWTEGREEAQELTFGEAPDWSADGRIVFRGCGPACQVWGLYVIDEHGGTPELLLADPSATAPAWSPDGRSVAFMSNRDGNWELYLVGDDGLGLRRLTNGADHDGVPTWSPDGRWIAFLSRRGGAWGVYALPVAAGGDVQLVQQVAGEYPDWMQEQLAWIP
ncbi:MAG: tetratricopeptide repeat protein [Chloroflexi bacterium]|nr:tetratricopeptide repeat protein [Chloroflexota bacterium]